MEKNVNEMSVREYDEHCEKVMAQFLDEHFYKKIGYTWRERVTDRERQVKGLDVILKRDGKVYNIDEKAAIRYTNGLNTFALELSFLNRKGNRVDGWLIDEKKVNDYFVFVWINKIEGELIENVDSFKEVEVALVSKEKIMIYLESLGWDVDKLLIKDERIRDGIDDNLGDIRKNGCKFSYSERLFEKPINILLPKQAYIKIADEHTIIMKSSRYS
jgi:hypothetical protein